MRGERFRAMAVVAGFAGSCAVGLAGCAQERALLTRQPLEDDKVGFGFFSHTEGGGAARNYKHWDNFSLVRDSEITGVKFWGLSEGKVSKGLDNFGEFTVEIWDIDDEGAPGEVLALKTLAVQDSHARPTGRFGIGGPDGASTGAEYEFTVMFDAPLRVKKDTEYFLAVTATRLDMTSDNFMWSDGQFDDGVTYSYSYDRQQMVRIEDTDSAMVILGRAR